MKNKRKSTIDGTVASLPHSPTEILLADLSVIFASRSIPCFLYRGVILDQVLTEVSYHVIVVIHHYAKWLSDNETRPHCDIAPSGAAMLLHLLTYQ